MSMMHSTTFLAHRIVVWGLLLLVVQVSGRHFWSVSTTSRIPLPSNAVYSRRLPSPVTGLVGGASTEGASAVDCELDETSNATTGAGTDATPTEPSGQRTAQDISNDIPPGGHAALKRQTLPKSRQSKVAPPLQTARFLPVANDITAAANGEVDIIGEIIQLTANMNVEVVEKKHGLLHKLVPRKPKIQFHKLIAGKLKNRNHTNFRRKVMHASFGLVFAGLNHLIPKSKFVPGMALLSSATLLMELLRYRRGFGWMNQILHFVLGSSLRKHEMDGKFTGSFYFFTGVTMTAALFPTTSATMGICQLALADPSASYFGRATRHVYWSRIENGLGGFGRNKGFLGFLGGALFCFPFNYRILSIAKFGAGGIPGGQTSLLAASLALGFAGAFADLGVPTPVLTLPKKKKICGVRVPPFHLDDNFVVPIVSGFACTQVLRALGWPQHLELARFLFIE